MRNEIQENLENVLESLAGSSARLIAVTKTHPLEKLQALYELGFKRFGENRVQALTERYENLPKDIEWHLIGTLQRNKVKYIAPFVAMIHSVDSFKLLEEINKQASKHERIIPCLLQVHIAEEETKFGLSKEELFELLDNPKLPSLQNITLNGLMGMATFTDKEQQIRNEFKNLKKMFDEAKEKTKNFENTHFTEISMGMSSDYPVAIEEGATLVRVGSAIFGKRAYS